MTWHRTNNKKQLKQHANTKCLKTVFSRKGRRIWFLYCFVVWLFTALLWTAPELLRMPSPPPEGSQKGDVYSFAIICQEIVYRKGPFWLEDYEYIPVEGALYNGLHLPSGRCGLAGFTKSCTCRLGWSRHSDQRAQFRCVGNLLGKLSRKNILHPETCD